MGSFSGLRQFLGSGIRFFRALTDSNYVGVRPPSVEPTTSFYLTLPTGLPAQTEALVVGADGQMAYQALAGGGGTVTSVALAAPSFLGVSGSPITAAGTLTLSLQTQAPNRVFAGPTTGSDAAPTFRALVYADLATLVGQTASTLAAGNDSRFHPQNSDTGTTQQAFVLDSDGATPLRLKNVGGELELRNSADTAYASLQVENLTVHGTTLTINSEVVSIADNIVILNSDVTGTPTQNSGLEVERGTVTNATLLWDESNDRWMAGVAGTEKRLSRTYQTSFIGGDLVAGVLTVVHDLGNQFPLVQVVDGSNKLVLPDEVTFSNVTTLTIDLTSFGSISNGWKVTVTG